MSTRDVARDKAAQLLRKRGSISSATSSSEFALRQAKKHGSMSTISFIDEPGTDIQQRPAFRYENSYQMTPGKRFPKTEVQTILQEVIESYLSEEKYEPELCRQMSKTLSEVVKARVKDLMIPRYKVICLMHIGQLNDQSIRVGSRCLWDPTNDTFASFEFRNNSLFAVGTVYGIYYE